MEGGMEGRGEDGWMDRKVWMRAFFALPLRCGVISPLYRVRSWGKVV